MNYIKKDFKRLEVELIENFTNIPTPVISDVMGRTYNRSCKKQRN